MADDPNGSPKTSLARAAEGLAASLTR